MQLAAVVLYQEGERDGDSRKDAGEREKKSEGERGREKGGNAHKLQTRGKAGGQEKAKTRKRGKLKEREGAIERE